MNRAQWLIREATSWSSHKEDNIWIWTEYEATTGRVIKEADEGMKDYSVEYVERGGMPGASFDTFQARSNKEAKGEYEIYFNQSVNRGHCGIRMYRVDPDTGERKCIFSKFRGA